MSPSAPQSPEKEAAAFANEFLNLMKAGRFPDYPARLAFLEKKYGRSSSTEERKTKFLRVASYIEEYLEELNHGMALIAGKNALAVSLPLVVAVYARFYMSKDGGAGATPQQVLDCYERLESLRKEG